MSETASPLVSLETYETHAVNIGTRQKSADMKRFIEGVRDDGLYLLDINIANPGWLATYEELTGCNLVDKVVQALG